MAVIYFLQQLGYKRLSVVEALPHHTHHFSSARGQSSTNISKVRLTVSRRHEDPEGHECPAE
ncbi:hypothetical protein INR49_001236 [Caranx melampygus]|nr:hypothetical protein INR49_001236 [Caranx melampygus]